MRINHIYILLTVLLMLCAACSSDEPEAAKERVTATFTIASRASQDADGAELINTWWMVFADKGGTVRLILDRPVDKNEAVEREEFKFELSEGEYTVYAFANISKSELGLNITEGLPMPDLTVATWDNETGVIGDFVPMTGTLDVNLTEGSKTFDVEVVRLWAKLCFMFTTDAGQTVTVSKITMTPALTQAVNLLPDYNSLGQAPVLPSGTICSELERNTAITVSGDGAVSETFYLFESTAESHPTGRYPIGFELKYGNGAARTVSALAYNLEYINRNDFVIIPVFITEWTVDVSVLFYPPIGGYPAVLTESKDDEFYAKFGSPGRFVVRPAVTSADGTVVAANNLDIVLTTEDTAGILSCQPAYDNNTSEIIGEIAAGKYGTAVVNLEIKIKTNEVVQQTITRKFYIIRQDS